MSLLDRGILRLRHLLDREQQPPEVEVSIPAVPRTEQVNPITEADLPLFPGAQESRNHRSIRDGYARGWGIQFGELAGKIRCDPLYLAALAVAEGRSILAEDKKMNLFLLLRFYLNRVSTGHIIEFGAFRGGNAIFMAYIAKQLHPGVNVYALDTFEGMPETDKKIDAHNHGDFSGVAMQELEDYTARLRLTNLHFVKGFFEDTASTVLQQCRTVALTHIDCDIYSAVRFSYEAVKPHMVPGGYLVFDDATFSSCIGATEVVEDLLIRRDGMNSEQIYPHFVFRAH